LDFQQAVSLSVRRPAALYQVMAQQVRTAAELAVIAPVAIAPVAIALVVIASAAPAVGYPVMADPAGIVPRKLPACRKQSPSRIFQS
jgi:hypothetical protein